MGVFRLNHAVLYVRDLDASVEFYSAALGFTTIAGMPGRAAFMRAPGSTNDHDLGLFHIGEQAADSLAGVRTVGLYHLAWEVDTLGDLEDTAIRLGAMGALVGSSDHGTTKSLYAKDPSGIEFEVVWLIPRDLLTDEDRAKASRIGQLDLQREIAKYGRDTPGGIGISRPDLTARV